MIKPFRIRDYFFNIHEIRGREFIETRPPDIPGVKELIARFEGSEIELERYTEELLALWYIIYDRKIKYDLTKRQWKQKEAPSYKSPENEIYHVLLDRHSKAAMYMYQYFKDNAKENALKVFKSFTNPEQKYRSIRGGLRWEHLEYICKVRGEDFFNQPAQFNTLPETYSWDDKQSIENDLTILWYIVLHIGPERKVRKSLGGETVDWMIYNRLKGRHDTMHRRMIEYIQKHPEVVPPLPDGSGSNNSD